jgi:hypothetical protein
VIWPTTSNISDQYESTISTRTPRPPMEVIT